MSRPADRVLIALIGEGARSYAQRAVQAIPDRVHTTDLGQRLAHRLELKKQCRPLRTFSAEELLEERRASLSALLTPMGFGSHARGCVDLITCATQEELSILRGALDVHIIAAPPFVPVALEDRYQPLWVIASDPECLWPLRHAIKLLDAGRAEHLSLRGDFA